MAQEITRRNASVLACTYETQARTDLPITMVHEEEMTIWHKLRKPFYALAPMEDATDTVFRQIIISCGRPDIMFTEFTNTTGLFSEGNEEVARRLRFEEQERPLIAQIWGIHPEDYFKATQQLVQMGFDGVDINMGCPVKKIISKGSCSALIKNHSLAQEIIHATREGIGDIPDFALSVKTRIGFDRIVTEEWIGFLLQQNLDALTIHGRTTKELSKVPNHWDEIGKAVTLKNEVKAHTILIGNGDIMTKQQGHEKIEQYGLDGIMIGRGVFENPWVFVEDFDHTVHSKQDRLHLFLQHVELYQETWGHDRYFGTLKKFVKTYVRGFEGAAELRDTLMQTKDIQELHQLIKKSIASLT